MCIHLTIAPLGRRTGTLEPAEITKATGLLAERRDRGALAFCPPGECPCGFASGGAPNSGTWRVREDLQGPLIAALVLAAQRMRRFRLSATWLGDPAAVERAVTLEELERVIAGGSIANAAFIVK